MAVLSHSVVGDSDTAIRGVTARKRIGKRCATTRGYGKIPSNGFLMLHFPDERSQLAV